ncbi:MAG: branched-chain amino acid ABC transporter permease [Chloroflexi bacterium]|nr:MAG: branched-chain amino acid ABC transporter permease [Chloroflexota bacterium]
MTIAASRRREFWLGVKDTIPLVIGAAPFGVIFGALSVNSGLSPLATMGLSLFVFAGSAQFIAVGLVAQGIGIGFIILTTFIVNLRHALYSASLAPYMKHLSQKWLLPLGFWLTDETYAVVIRRWSQEDNSPHKHWYHLGSSVVMYGNWQLCTLLGIIAGQQPWLAELGLDFAMTVTFIGIVVPLLTKRPMVLCALVAGGVALAFHGLPNKMGLMLAALSGIAAGYYAETRSAPHFEAHKETAS